MTSSTTAKTWTPADLPELRKYEGTIWIKNVSPFLFTLHENVNDKRVDLELKPQGQADSVAILPNYALDAPGIGRNWLKGKIAISPDDAMLTEMTQLSSDAAKVAEERIAEVMAPLQENKSHKDLVAKLCLKCGKTDERTGQTTGQVFQTVAEVKAVTPPLCAEHKSLASQYLPTLGINAKGEEEWTFSSPVTVTETRKG